MDKKPNQTDFNRDVRVYHGLPMLIAVLIIVGFVAIFYITDSAVLSGIVVGVPSVILIWYWAAAARRVDQWVCPKCGSGLGKKLPWIYPPRNCPKCGERI